MESGDEEEPSTPKKTKYSKRKQTNAPKTPKKETKGSKALKFFSNPYFRMDDNGVNNTFYSCSLCKKELCGNNLINLASHLLHKHEQVYVRNIGAIEDPIEVKRLKLLQNCVSIVGLSGRPFTSLCDYGFQQIVHEQLEQFNKAGISLDIKNDNQPAVHAHLKESAEQVRNAIKNSVKQQALSIQLDIATRLRRSFFSINAQYIFNKRLHIVNIGMLELEKAHTAIYLSQTYRKCIDRYNISKSQVVSISGDNGANVQKFIRIEQSENPVVRRLDFDAANDIVSSKKRDTTLVDMEIEAVLATDEMVDEEDDAMIMEIFENCGIDVGEKAEYEQLLKDTIDEVSKQHEQELFDMTGVNCAAHTLQLLVKDALKELKKESSNVIDLCRRIIKSLKLNSTKNVVEEARKNAESEFITKQLELKLKVPSLDVETRWGSTFLMVSFFVHSLLLIIQRQNKNQNESKNKETM